MLKDLVKVANRLDSLGLSKEADIVDRLITKLAHLSRDEAPSLYTFLIKDYVDGLIKKMQAEEKSAPSYSEQQRIGKSIDNLNKFISDADDKVFLTTEDGFMYTLWLEDPLDPRSAADPRKENGMSVRITQPDLIAAIGKEHFNYINEAAKNAGLTLSHIKQSGYGEWQFKGDLSLLDQHGYNSDVLK